MRVPPRQLGASAGGQRQSAHSPSELALYNRPLTARTGVARGPWIWVASRLILLAVVLRNARVSTGARPSPWLLAALGLGLNTLVIAANDG